MLKEECGVFGMYSYDGMEVSHSIYSGLFALQHRGQESCGIAVGKDGETKYHKAMGLVKEVFTRESLDKLEGTMGVGHVRYSTTGESIPENCQPLVSRYVKGTLTIAHNGNLTNDKELKKEFEQTGAIFQTTIDSEVIAYAIARERVNSKCVEEAVLKGVSKLTGAFSLLVMSPRKIVAARDRFGFRPLCMGKVGETIVFASESCALDAVGAEFIRDIEPGEVVVVDDKGIRSSFMEAERSQNICIFEYIYFSRPDSVIAGVGVQESRQSAGKILARKMKTDADIVIGVPESGIDSALGFAMESGIPYSRGFVKNTYVGRTFIKPSQKEREQSVSLKLNIVKSCVKGKKVVMVDDSLVRGTTSAKIVKQLKEAGATEVHVRIAAPMFKYPCYYGTDVANSEELISNTHDLEGIRQFIGADSLLFLDIEDLPETLLNKVPKFCDACFTGNYAD